MDNLFSQDEVGHTLELLGASSVMPYKGGWRSSCPIHMGDGDKAFAVWTDDSGTFRASCHSHHCVRAATLEWVVAKAKTCSLREAVGWLSTQLGRPLLLPDMASQRDIILMPSVPDDISYCDEEALGRLCSTYPYHAYWKSRDYSPEIVAEYRLAYRSLDQRMVIPVFSEEGFVGMVTRATDPTDSVKYRWESPNTNKVHWLFGVPQALKRPLNVRGRRTVFLVEGTLDPIHAAECGFPVVATQTNRLSMDQVQQLIAHWDLVIVIPDGDSAGQELVKDAKKLASPFLEMAVAPLQGAKDLDEVPKEQLPQLLTTITEDWRTAWDRASRRQKNFLTLNPSASAV